MFSIAKLIPSRTTSYGFIAVILLFVIVVTALLIQVEFWSKTSFALISNNYQQARHILVMEDAVQKRELSTSRMISMPINYPV